MNRTTKNSEANAVDKLRNKLNNISEFLDPVWKLAPDNLTINGITLVRVDKSANHGKSTNEGQSDSEAYVVYNATDEETDFTNNIKLIGYNSSYSFEFTSWKFVSGKPVQIMVWE